MTLSEHTPILSWPPGTVRMGPSPVVPVPPRALPPLPLLGAPPSAALPPVAAIGGSVSVQPWSSTANAKQAAVVRQKLTFLLRRVLPAARGRNARDLSAEWGAAG